MATRNLAVLLGAGASYGAGPVSPYPPPLGPGLYGELKKAYPETWGSLVQPDEDVALRADPPFEAGMALLWQRREERVQRLIIDMARYFTRFEPSGPTYYERLVRLISQPTLQVAFCSLNYECIFERVVWRMGGEVASLNATHGSPNFRIQLLKPHGSCNYIMEAMANPTNSFTNITMSGVGAYYDGPLAAVDPAQIESFYVAGPSMPPAISIYEPAKSSPVGASHLEAIREGWRLLTKQADAVLCIGARPVRQDSHIWEPIIRSDAEVWFVGGGDDDLRWLSGEVGSRLRHLASRFASAIPLIGGEIRRLTR